MADAVGVDVVAVCVCVKGLVVTIADGPLIGAVCAVVLAIAPPVVDDAAVPVDVLIVTTCEGCEWGGAEVTPWSEG